MQNNWIARDSDGDLYIYINEKPERHPESIEYKDHWAVSSEIPPDYENNNRTENCPEDEDDLPNYAELPIHWFPDLKWEDEPIQVAITPI